MTWLRILWLYVSRQWCVHEANAFAKLAAQCKYEKREDLYARAVEVRQYWIDEANGISDRIKQLKGQK